MLKLTDVHRVLSQPAADKTLSIYAQVDPSLFENQGGRRAGGSGSRTRCAT
ncbi:hypothetical protein OV079_52985 [Nannocystis pusilla]|uniref:Uncharacterized protein n=1 Tax=Nannocystis pusilla TaxID=889268 RepID=A0A9X3J4A1_9BACT|nr:hypothetical protein [Nannocystis pusilla]MCY1014095.1 hypothetical protein [Nannocystis pusilla]